MDEKSTGSFYTPNELVKYMVGKVLAKRKPNSILEPSAGDGRFLLQLAGVDTRLCAVEIDGEKIDSIRRLEIAESIHTDFLDFAMSTDEKFDLIIGNPPYISKKNLPLPSREKSVAILKKWDLPESIFQNLWVSFIVAALQVLEESAGVVFFVLPFEFLQVQYAEKLRRFLELKFNLIEITTFQERVFPSIEQDVCLVYLEKKPGIIPMIKCISMDNALDFTVLDTSEIKRNKPLQKWSNSILNDDEMELLLQVSERYTRVADLGAIAPGIVTGANGYFILDSQQVKDFKCEELVLPIVSWYPSQIGGLELRTTDFHNISVNCEPTWLLSLTDHETELFSSKLKTYLVDGELSGISDRHKCSRRKRWFDVPVGKNGSVLFFKRYDQIPRILVNSADVFTTDVSYNIRVGKDFNPMAIAFCFYNTLTLTQCEYHGRFYGGGVAELVPSEFKKLTIPYKDIERADFFKLDQMFRNREGLEKITTFVDSITLSGLSSRELAGLRRIREKYLLRRIGKVRKIT